MPIPTWLRTPPEKGSKVERKYTLALSNESSESTKVVVAAQAGSARSPPSPGRVSSPFFLPTLPP